MASRSITRTHSFVNCPIPSMIQPSTTDGIYIIHRKCVTTLCKWYCWLVICDLAGQIHYQHPAHSHCPLLGRSTAPLDFQEKLTPLHISSWNWGMLGKEFYILILIFKRGISSTAAAVWRCFFFGRVGRLDDLGRFVNLVHNFRSHSRQFNEWGHTILLRTWSFDFHKLVANSHRIFPRMLSVWKNVRLARQQLLNKRESDFLYTGSISAGTQKQKYE